MRLVQRNKHFALMDEIRMSKEEFIQGYRRIRKVELKEQMETILKIIHQSMNPRNLKLPHRVRKVTAMWLLLWEEDYVFTNAIEKNDKSLVAGSRSFMIVPKPSAKIPQRYIWYIHVLDEEGQVATNQLLPEKKKIILSERIRGNPKRFKCPQGYRKLRRLELKERESEARSLAVGIGSASKYVYIGIWEDDQIFTNAHKNKNGKMAQLSMRTKFRSDSISRFLLIQKSPTVIQKSLPQMKLSFFETHEFIRDFLFELFEGNITHVILSFIHFSTGTYTNSIFGDLKVYLNFETKKWAAYDKSMKISNRRSQSMRKRWGTFTLPKQVEREYCKTPDGLQSSIKLQIKELGNASYDTRYGSDISLRWIPSYGLQYYNQVEYNFLTFDEFACTLNFDLAKKMEVNEREFSAIDWIMDVATSTPLPQTDV